MADKASTGSMNPSFNPNFSSELNIESLISAPLIAASKANTAMVTGQTRFLLENCFKKNKETETLEPVMITMALSKSVVDSSKSPGDPGYIKMEIMNFMLPLLCIVPLSSIAVDKVTIDFDMEITSVSSYQTEHRSSDKQAVLHGKNGVLEKRAILNGKVCNSNRNNDSARGHYKSQNSSTLKVNVNAGTLPLPLGVLTILEMYNKSIQPTQSEK